MSTQTTQEERTNPSELPKLPKLTPKQQIFVEAYFSNNWNASKAAKAAGYKDNSAGTTGYELLKKPQIKAHIDAHLQVIREDHRATHEKMTRDLIQVQEVDIADFIEVREDGKTYWRKDYDRTKTKHIQSITFGPKGITIKLEDKSTARDMLNKHMGFYEADNKQKQPEGPQIYLPSNGRDPEPHADTKKPPL